jgi:hydrogenase maturation protein HypF
LDRLHGIADLFLVHDRPIVRPVDDSVVRIIAGAPTVLRNARGLAPTVLSTPDGAPGMALGGHQKNAIALHLGDRIVLGPHIGDLDSAGTRHALERAAAELPGLYRLNPERVACDAHPDYYTTHLAERLGPRRVAVPHHLAHVLSGMAENRLDAPVLGIAWDGTGYGGDGTIWGGEFIAAADGRWRRTGHLLPFPLPGGEAAMRQPWRAALGVLFALGGETEVVGSAIPARAGISARQAQTLAAALSRGVNAPLTSSAGRLFDAAAALLGLCINASFEGEAAMALEFAADAAKVAHALPPAAVTISASGRLALDWRPTLAALAADAARGTAPGPLARGFHIALADAILAVARHVNIGDVLLTGGCFQNALLTELAHRRLTAAGFDVHLHRRLPPNDGALAVGQAMYAARPLQEE